MTRRSPSFSFTPHPTSSSRDTTTTTTTTWRTWQHGHHVIVDPSPITAPLIDDLPFAIPLVRPTPYLIQSRHNDNDVKGAAVWPPRHRHHRSLVHHRSSHRRLAVHHPSCAPHTLPHPVATRRQRRQREGRGSMATVIIVVIAIIIVNPSPTAAPRRQFAIRHPSRSPNALPHPFATRRRREVRGNMAITSSSLSSSPTPCRWTPSPATLPVPPTQSVRDDDESLGQLMLVDIRIPMDLPMSFPS